MINIVALIMGFVAVIFWVLGMILILKRGFLGKY